jgi:ribosomal protein S18 acetylase RimI-like enzyme
MAQTHQPIRIRPMEVDDFRFIRNLASKQFQFTRPPHYVLWLLTRTNSRSCIVAEDTKHGLVAYLLSLPVNTSREKTLYVWQLAASPRGRHSGAIHLLLLALRKLVRRMRIRSLVFTAVPDSPEYRAIRRYAKTLSGAAPRAKQSLPSRVSQNEHEFVIRVR